MTLSTNATLHPFNCVSESHLTIGSLPSDPRMDTLYRAPVKSGADLGGSRLPRRSSAASSCERFFSAHTIRYGGCARDALVHAGNLGNRSANLRTVAPIRCLAASGDGSNSQGALPMQHPTQGASASRHYEYSVVAPSHLKTATITAESPRKALSVFAEWFVVPAADIAISRRVPVQGAMA